MKNDFSKWCMLAAVLLLGAAVATAQQQGATGVKVNPSAVQQKAQAPPPANAAPTTSVGDQTKMATPAGSVSWAAQVDVDGDGQADQATLAWDAKDKVLIGNKSGTFTCANGEQGTGEILVAVNGQGNRWDRPVGSGFWVASLKKGECGAQADTLFGCKFDASGSSTICGAGQIDEQNADLVIVATKPGS
jgi:hypothetical protein